MKETQAIRELFHSKAGIADKPFVENSLESVADSVFQDSKKDGCVI